MSRELLITILTYATPCASGVLLAIFGLYRKYPTEMKYIYRLFPTWIYISLSAAGSLGFTLYLASKGTQVVGDPVLNAIIFGIVSPAVFLGVASRFSVSSSSPTGAGKQLKTLQEYIYTTLEDAITRKKMQTVELKIRDAATSANPQSFLEEASNLLDALPKVTPTDKKKIKARFDRANLHGDYAFIIRELIKHCEVDFVIEWFSPEAQLKRASGALQQMIRVAMSTHKSDEAIPPAFIIAKVQALQKEPDGSLYHLKRALQAMPSLKTTILTNEVDWWILASMTHGERQQEKLQTLLSLVGIRQPALQDIEQHFLQREKLPATLMAIRRNNGDCMKILLSSGQDEQGHGSTWWIRSDGDGQFDMSCANLGEAMSQIEKVAIPIRLF